MRLCEKYPEGIYPRIDKTPKQVRKEREKEAAILRETIKKVAAEPGENTPTNIQERFRQVSYFVGNSYRELY